MLVKRAVRPSQSRVLRLTTYADTSSKHVSRSRFMERRWRVKEVGALLTLYK